LFTIVVSLAAGPRARSLAVAVAAAPSPATGGVAPVPPRSSRSYDHLHVESPVGDLVR